MKKIFYFKLSIKLIFAITLVLLSSISLSRAATSPDAIGFRVMPNPNHLSPLRWYKDNKFNGAPQNLIVDGYEAVRDGRTVYVNAANIDLTNWRCSKTQSICSIASGCGSADPTNTCVPKYYTNIYVISYNQQAENQTVDIFGQILEHWKFNVNISDDDVCSKIKATTITTACLYSSQCPAGEYCLSQKARVIRDTKRLADLADIKTVLDNYQGGHSGKYPTLSAGSYLPGKSVSVWPSWKGTLSQELAVTLPVDPINKLGACANPAGFDPITCWNQAAKRFADPPPDNQFNLPIDSRAYVYTTDNGNSFVLCANMESGLISEADGRCLGNTLTNNPPIIQTINFAPGGANERYRRFVQASDPDGDTLAWSINTANANWTSWSAPPALRPAGISNQIEVYADRAGSNGSYNISLTVSDGRGGATPKDFVISISSCTDGDGDGFNLQAVGCGQADCDDANEFAYPGATETCDGADNNCLGGRDEGCDDDGDRYCDSQMKIYNNTGMCNNTIYTGDGKQGDDCDDAKGSINPGMNGGLTYCGDGRVQTNPQNDHGIAETCDDCNTIKGDGCNENCQRE